MRPCWRTARIAQDVVVRGIHRVRICEQGEVEWIYQHRILCHEENVVVSPPDLLCWLQRVVPDQLSLLLVAQEVIDAEIAERAPALARRQRLKGRRVQLHVMILQYDRGMASPIELRLPQQVLLDHLRSEVRKQRAGNWPIPIRMEHRRLHTEDHKVVHLETLPHSGPQRILPSLFWEEPAQQAHRHDRKLARRRARSRPLEVAGCSTILHARKSAQAEMPKHNNHPDLRA
mmetsp:Transcript_45942/g.127504  ORF Transcript_45942/g.127504 Transcript_45942/m.127504 type:complete len:231 (+) Transcript_45942:347-1039(+)